MVTQVDIAQQVGVTQATVSRVLAGKGSVDEVTRAGVLAAAKELRYRPHSNNDARRLVARRHGTHVRSNVVALLWPAPDSPLEDAWLARLLEGVEARLSKADQQLLLTKFRHEQRRLPPNIRAGHVDGVIVICPSPQWHDLLLGLDVPVVGLGNQVLPMHVCSDDRGAGRTATDHLLALGHRRIAFLSPSARRAPNPVVRQAGYQEAVEGAGLGVDQDLVVAQGDLSVAQGDRLFRQFWQEQSGVTAIVAYNDEIARGILEAADSMGIRVPGELSVVGVDDMPWASLLKPPLTTLRLPLRKMGEVAAEVLLTQIRFHFDAGNNGQIRHRRIEEVCRRLEAELVVRESTAPPSRSAE